jgi:hypothetical protein
MAPRSSHCPDSFSEQQLGQELRAMVTRQESCNLPYSIIFGQLQDLLGDDTALLGPLRDLLGRPAFQQMAGLARHSVRIGARDALLQNLSETYNSAMVLRLAAVLDGFLGLPTTSVPPAVRQNSTGSPTTVFPQTECPSPPFAPHPIPPTNPPPRNSGSSLLLALLGLLSGALLVSFVWLFSGNHLQLANISKPPRDALKKSEPPVAPDNPVAPATPKDSNLGQLAWGSATDYKFGQLPGGEYPQSCAFSSTAPGGQIIIDKSQLEFWACRDLGGDGDNGYKVAWADGKETTYKFEADGSGEVVGTNGDRYPMRWRNDNHNGDLIIVINHQDGAISWIPGKVS